MYNDSIETLLLRHYGATAPVPTALEQRITVSVHQLADEQRQRDLLTRNLRENRISRRRAIQLVALGSAGIGLLSTGVGCVQAALDGQGSTQVAHS
ncbi:MAG: hypothetical protein NVS2B12_33080 [Ktedonobacteraceae bacterium]